MHLKDTIQHDARAALRARDKQKTAALRLVIAAVKQVEVDERRELGDADVIAVLGKMAKQRRDSIAQYTQGGRPDLAANEQAELDLIQTYLPRPLDEGEIDAMIAEAIAETGASSMKDMGRLMGILKPRLQGRADLAAVSGKIKARLS